MDNTKRNLLIAAGAVGFGLSIKSKFSKTTSTRFTILYATRYGATYDAAKWIRQGIGTTTRLLSISDPDVSSHMQESDYLIVGSGIWTEGVHKGLTQVLDSTSEEIRRRVIASFVVCGTRPNSIVRKNRIAGYLQQINQHLENQPVFSEGFGGRLIFDQLSKPDRISIGKFYERIKREKTDWNWDRTDKNSTIEFGKMINDYETKFL